MQVPDDFDELRHFDRVRLGKGSGSDDADSRRAGGGNPNWRVLRSLQTHVAKRDDESPGKRESAEGSHWPEPRRVDVARCAEK